MRVRHLHSFLQERQLLKISSLEELSGRRLGIDAVYWLRGLPCYPDALLGPTGEGRAALVAAIREELLKLKEIGITPVFVFRGIEPPGHHLFSQQQPQVEAWEGYYANGREAASPQFAGCCSRVPPDAERLALQLLQQLGYEALHAAYLTPPQLAYLLQTGFIHAALAPPSVLLFGLSRIITQLDVEGSFFTWLEKSELLQSLGVTEEQLADSCLLAGTDYCLTFPYLNLTQFQPGSSCFSFGSAVEFIRQAPISSYLHQFPSDQMKFEHVDGYCVGKCLLSYPLVLKETGHVEIFTSGSAQQPARAPLPPKDFAQIVGLRLPPAVYVHLAQGRLSRNIAVALAQGEWAEPCLPTVNSVEYAEAFSEATQYRLKALWLVAMHLHSKFQNRPVVFSRVGGEGATETGAHALPPVSCSSSLKRRWHVSAAAVAAELHRQNKDSVDLGFCLEWFANAPDQQKQHLFFGEPEFLPSLCCVQEAIFVCLELLKMGLLSGDPIEPPSGKPYPSGVQAVLMRPYPGASEEETSAGTVQRAALLLQRIASLLPLRINQRRPWESDICMDFMGYNCVVCLIRSALREVTEAALVSKLLKHAELVEVLPRPEASQGFLPLFPSSGYTLGLVTRWFLHYEGAAELAAFEAEIRAAYPAAEDPVSDLCAGLKLWQVFCRLLKSLSFSVDVADLLEDVHCAEALVARQVAATGIKNHPAFKL
ncbi:xpg N-terminal domain-containing protein [Cyclospora cayetanensis]|uniref:Xpg N-terminal domain-containing protein n=1 Tax=Cyclospora cayetanensis TaxID=88456 RepID=A0A1D3DB01_9EIME|nr:xpg N-terminal domain-containing protein [Cyclospora cayetanensis]